MSVVGHHVQYEINNALVNVVILFETSVSAEESYENIHTNEEEALVMKLDVASLQPEEGFEDDAAETAHNNRYADIATELEGWIEAKCEAVFKDLSASLKPYDRDSTLNFHQFIHPVTINLEIKTINGVVTVIRHDDNPPWPAFVETQGLDCIGVKLPEDAAYPVYLSPRVQVVDSSGTVPKVLIDGVEYRCKLNKDPGITKYEHDKYLKMMAIGVKKLNVPAFKGYVKDSATSDVFGLLIEDIKSENRDLLRTMGEPSFPSAEPGELPTLERRQKWISQIEHTIKQLHEHDVIWGDVKPENVIIDTDDNARLIDFGGGGTMPWKNYLVGDTKEADLDAVQLLVEYLRTGEKPPLPEGLFRANATSVDDEDEDVSDAASTSAQGSRSKNNYVSPRKRKRTGCDGDGGDDDDRHSYC